MANYVQQSGTSLYFPIEQAVLEKSIIYGSLFDEWALQADTITNTAFNVLFSYCLIKSPGKSDPYFNRVTWSNASNGLGNDTVFASTRYDKESGYFNFQLVENSMARGRGNVTVAQQYPLDMNGNSRFNGGFPDLGAYEW